MPLSTSNVKCSLYYLESIFNNLKLINKQVMKFSREKRICIVYSTIIFICSLLANYTFAQQEIALSKEEAAKKAAEFWLTFIDATKYVESYENASQQMRDLISKKEWKGVMEITRTPLGEVQSREFKSAKFVKSLKAAPEHEGMIIEYQSSFTNKDSATELITLILQKNGQWQVTAYFIR